MKTLEQGVEAEMRQAESKPTVALEKAETYGNAGMSDPAMGRNVVRGRIRGQGTLRQGTNFETGNQEEGKGGRHTGSQAKEGQPGATASPASASPFLWQETPSRALTGQDF